MQVSTEQLIKGKFFTFMYTLENDKLLITRLSPFKTENELISLKLKTVDKMGTYKKSEHEYKSYDRKIFACKSKKENAWYFVFKDFYGTVLLVINPDEKLLESIKPHIPKHLSFDVFVRGRK